MKRGLLGFAIWDHGEKGVEGVPYNTQSDFYEKDLEYKLKNFGEWHLRTTEFQSEAHLLETEYPFTKNKGGIWANLDLMSLRGFERFILNNEFMSLHLRASDVDIAESQDDSFREYSTQEVNASMDFGFRLNADALTLHPGTVNRSVPASKRGWPKTGKEAKKIMRNREIAMEKSLWQIVEHYIDNAVALEKLLAQHANEQKTGIESMQGLFKEIRESDDDSTYYENSGKIARIIRELKIPPAVVRAAKHPRKSLHLCIENIEPGNFMINTPAQHVRWLNTTRQIYREIAGNHLELGNEMITKYMPMMLVDSNHYVNSQCILGQKQNAFLEAIFPDFEEFLERDYVAVPGLYEKEPILNRLMRVHGDDIFYFHLAGCNKRGDHFSTHDPVKPIRYGMRMRRLPEGMFYPKYSSKTFVPEKELNLGDVIQIAGLDKTFILEVFNVAKGVMLSSEIHANDWLDHLAQEHEYMQRKVLAEADRRIKNPADAERFKQRIRNAKFYLRPHTAEELISSEGYDEAGFYEFGDDSRPIRYLATVKELNGRIWFNPKIK
ncbi:MAG: hypothetical protein U9R08_03205 [Nanoarchaeota archaeon]|nr:hypothetical protein [Nanoarchaeota archaeon]